MSGTGERKIKISANLTERMVTAIRKEATRLGISDNDVVRRIMDAWCDQIEASRAKPIERVLVLDREKSELRRAR